MATQSLKPSLSIVGQRANNSAGYGRQALLPEGFRDELYPVADQNADFVNRLLARFYASGYDRVKPPLVEYEDSLFAGPGAVKADQTFRLMDPDTQRVMGVRADMTPQISRIAATRLAVAARPLRLTYAGTVLRVIGSQIRPTREFVQAGVELIGASSVEADVEVISLAVDAVTQLGAVGLTVDLTLAPLTGMICRAYDIDSETSRLIHEALASRDSAALESLVSESDHPLRGLMRVPADAGSAVAALRSLALDGEAGDMILGLQELVERLTTELPQDVGLTVDPCENHGFEYKTGIGFALFAAGSRAELGRGGRYTVTHPSGAVETATGFSAYMDSLVSALPKPDPAPCLFVGKGAAADIVKAFQSAGYRTVRGLEDVENENAEALRLGCSHRLVSGKAVPVEP